MLFKTGNFRKLLYHGITARKLKIECTKFADQLSDVVVASCESAKRPCWESVKEPSTLEKECIQMRKTLISKVTIFPNDRSLLRIFRSLSSRGFLILGETWWNVDWLILNILAVVKAWSRLILFESPFLQPKRDNHTRLENFTNVWLKRSLWHVVSSSDPSFTSTRCASSEIVRRENKN